MFDTLRGGARSERGSAAVQSAILFPIALLLVFGIIQGALWFHARQIALGAAQEGARAASAENGVGGNVRAHEFVNDLTGGTLLQDLVVEQSISADTVTIVVRGTAPSLIPGVSGLVVEQHATASLEEFSEVNP